MTLVMDEPKSLKLETLANIGEAAGTLALELFEAQAAREVTIKSPQDYVSDADRLVEEFVRERLRNAFPGMPVIGEELGGDAAGTYWSVDPIDGTSNFLSGLPFWAVSIGLIENGEPTAGTVVAPALAMACSGSIEHGFFSECLSSSSAPSRPVCFAIGRNNDWDEKERKLAEDRIASEGYNIVGYGSCALSLMLVAAGRLGGYVERSVSGMWDCAGGAALCKSVGANVVLDVDHDGKVSVDARL